MKTDIYWVVGLGAAAGLGYWYFVARPKAAAAATSAKPTLPQGGVPVVSQPGVPAAGGLGALSKVVTLTAPLSANDMATGLMQIFTPGQSVNVLGAPVGGITTFTDNQSPPHVYMTQSVVAGLFH